MRLPPIVRAVGTGGLAAGVGLTAYAVWETRAFSLRDVTVPLLPPGQPSLRVLHLSDIHLTPGQQRKQDWLAGLCALDPDLVVNTGDNIAHRDSIPRLRDALGSLLDVPGVFVLGSNDYYSPTLRNPLRYLFPDNGKRHTDSPLLPWRELKDLVHRLRLARPDQPACLSEGRSDDVLVRRRRRPAPALRPARRGGRPGRCGRRRAAGRGPRAVPAGAGPVRGRRVRRDPGRPHPRRPGVCARRRRADHQLRPRAGPGQGPAPPSGALDCPAIRARPGCTSRPGSAPAPTPRCGWPAAPRRPC